ncbi:phosphatase PAP2 family protein [Sphaerisporangium aureirubrum]|uniref:Phosphatase PAP2 family protein n=1 Tax=Sphaerisporangium aureirubrum TaxID=1544736 RepID=A0ABW1NC57_9ACTN
MHEGTNHPPLGTPREQETLTPPPSTQPPGRHPLRAVREREPVGLDAARAVRERVAVRMGAARAAHGRVPAEPSAWRLGFAKGANTGRAWRGVPAVFRPSLRGRVKRRLNALDKRLFRQVASAHLPGFDRVLPPLSRAADNSVLWAGIAAALASTGRVRLRRAATRGLLAIGLASPLVNLLGKQAFARNRPSIADFPLARLGRVPTSHSFPSGHSASAAAFAAGVALEAPPEIAVPVAVAAGAVCFSRVYTGVHYPGDVLAGASVGIAAAILTGRLMPRTTRDHPRLPSGPDRSSPARTD